MHPANSRLLQLLSIIAVVAQTAAFFAPSYAPAHFSKNTDITRHQRHASALYDQPFKMRMPWDPPEPPQQERKTRKTKKEELRQKRPQKPRNTYDLYGAPPITDEVDGYINSEHKSTLVGKTQQPKLGVILIDHGSKKQASYDDLHSIAERYEAMLKQRLESSSEEVLISVRASHMEEASPSIESALRSIVDDGATTVICVPYFLSRGRHISIDLPNLIEDAKDVLEEEGLFNGVDVQVSKHLGSDVNSMIEVVDDLVKTMIRSEDSYSWMLSDACEGNDGKTSDSLQDELHKYTNRSKLLEDMLNKKVQQLKTMKNRVTILEDVLNKKLEENDRLREKLRATAGQSHKNNVESNIPTNFKELTELKSTIDALENERADLLNELKVMEAQKVDLEKDYNTTMSELMSEMSSLEEQVKKQNATNLMLQSDLAASRQSKKFALEKQQNETVGEQQRTIKDLQSQLAELLDAYNELEQLQNETEASLSSYKSQLLDARQENDQLVDDLASKSEEYQRHLDESQRLSDEDKVRSLNLLQESRREYEELLANEQDETTEWKDKYNELVAGQSLQKDSATVTDIRPEEDWAQLKAELQEALDASVEAAQQIKELRKQQQQDKDSTSSLRKELEQQQQLQEYLKGQIQTYYETIEEQSKQLAEYKELIVDMQKKHNESMLIATNSVQASQRREADLLNNIEELEGELNDMQKEKSNGDKKMKEMQTQVDTASSVSKQTKGDTDNQHTHLSIEIESLRHQLDVVSKEKERILTKNVRLEQIIVDKVLGEDHMADETASDAKPKQSRLRYVLRPWTILKRR